MSQRMKKADLKSQRNPTYIQDYTLCYSSFLSPYNCPVTVVMKSMIYPFSCYMFEYNEVSSFYHKTAHIISYLCCMTYNMSSDFLRFPWQLCGRCCVMYMPYIHNTECYWIDLMYIIMYSIPFRKNPGIHIQLDTIQHVWQNHEARKLLASTGSLHSGGEIFCLNSITVSVWQFCQGKCLLFTWLSNNKNNPYLS